MRLGEIGTIFDGPHATPKRVTEGPYFLNIASLKGGRLDLTQSDHVTEEQFEHWTRRVTPETGDLLFSYETRLGEAALMPPEVRACLGRRMALLRPNRARVCPRFLLYWYLAPFMQGTIEQRTIQGATVPRLPLSAMPTWEIGDLPPLDEQKAIAEVLGALDDKIAANTELIVTLERHLKAHYETYLTPKSTPLTRVDDVLLLSPKRVAPAILAPQLTMQDLPSPGLVIPTSRVGVPNGGVRFMNGDTLLARITPCLENGKTGYVSQLGDDEVGFGSTEYIVMRSREGLPLPLSYFIATDERFRSQAMLRMVGSSGRQRVKASDLADLTISMTDDKNVLAQFGEIAESHVALAGSLNDESRTLAELRDTLLPALMDGTIKVKDAVASAEEVL